MNKDQKLLEEAYCKIYESVVEPLYFGPEKDKQKRFEWLKEYNYEVHEDGSVSIKEGCINLEEEQLTRIPFNFRKIGKDFRCYRNQLTTLEGAPEIVGGSFYCSDNKLTSLEGGPKEVGGSYDCSRNLLRSLEGAPKNVGGGNKNVRGNFLCYGNKITSLEGAPDFVEGRFNSDNFSDRLYKKLKGLAKKRKEPIYFGPPKEEDDIFYWLLDSGTHNVEVHDDGSVSVEGDLDLTRFQNLKRIPFNFRKVGGKIWSWVNNLTSFEGFPQYVEGDINVANGKLTSLKDSPRYIGGDFSLYGNQIASLEGAPEEIKGAFECDQFSDEDYRAFARKQRLKKRLDVDLEKDLNPDLGDFE